MHQIDQISKCHHTHPGPRPHHERQKQDDRLGRRLQITEKIAETEGCADLGGKRRFSRLNGRLDSGFSGLHRDDPQDKQEFSILIVSEVMRERNEFIWGFRCTVVTAPIGW